MQNAIEALEYNLRSIEIGVKELEETRQHQVKGLDRIRLQITEANRKHAETQQALELLRAVSGFGEKKADPRKDANIAQYRAVNSKPEKVQGQYNPGDPNRGNQAVEIDRGGCQGPVNFLRDAADDTPAPRKATTQERAPGFGGL